MSRHVVRILAVLATLFAPAAALAHAGHTDGAAFMAGLAHPVSGVDHLLAMIAVGLWAAQRGGRALWMLPLAFVGMMAVSGIAGIAGLPLSGIEAGIGLSVLALGLAVALRPAWSTGFCAVLAAVFAVFHGHAHGAEMPAAAQPILYGAGFVLATVLLHVSGIGMAASIQAFCRGRMGHFFTRGLGVLVGAAGGAGLILG